MHEDKISQKDADEEHHFVGWNIGLILAVIVSQFSYDRVEDGFRLEVMPLFFGQRTDVLFAFQLVWVVWADELIGKEQKGNAENEEGRDEPESKG